MLLGGLRPRWAEGEGWALLGCAAAAVAFSFYFSSDRKIKGKAQTKRKGIWRKIKYPQAPGFMPYFIKMTWAFLEVEK